ncbi:PREDICTED: uncharacterized protein LOC109153150 [Ipomoea nil]|uniref:uncharacterized protein LOC109153150 n=1 Tax=Ipomoea nil TaxID=35883 RepID=UPI000900D429|nr:PREDICTED: uncharacterized protein LOC109153150 [Ipomoea nil]
MVSERRHSYAVVVMMSNEIDEGNSARQTSPPANQNPISHSPIQRSDGFDDPFYLHITENPNFVLVSPPLSEHNYASWSRSMKIALDVKNKFGFANGSIPNPGEGDPKFYVWRRCNNIVCSWILKSLNSSIAETVLYYEIPADIWKSLKKRYSQADPHRIAELQNQIYRNLCTCNLLRKMQKERADDQVIRFLDGLNDEFESIKSGALVMDPIPDMEKVINMALKIERKFNGSIVQRSNELVQSNVVQSG